MTQTADIIQLQGKQWISESALTKKVNVSGGYLRKARCMYRQFVDSDLNGGCMPDAARAWRFARLHGQFYYCHDNLPDRNDTRYRSRVDISGVGIQTPRKLQREIEKDLCKDFHRRLDYGDARWYMYQCNIYIEEDRANRLAVTLAWYRTIIDWADNRLYEKHKLFSKAEFWDIAADILKGENTDLNISKGESLRVTLHGFKHQTAEAQRMYIISGKIGNRNRLREDLVDVEVIDELSREPMTTQIDIHDILLEGLWINPEGPNKFTKEMIYEQYRVMTAEMDIKGLAYRTVCYRLNRFAVRAQLSLGRDGNKDFNSAYMPYAPQLMPRFSLSYVVADGSGTKLAYRELINGKWEQKSLYTIHFFDVASRALIGYSISTSMEGESKEKAIEAFCMAVETGGYIEWDTLLTDNGSAFSSAKSKRYFTKVARRVRSIALGNSQANDAEWMGRLLHQQARICANWMYGGFESSRHNTNNRHNPDKWNIEDLPTRNQAIAQLKELINKWNNTPHGNGQAPMEVFQNNKNKALHQLPEQAQRYTGGFMTPVDLDYMRGFVQVSKDKKILQQKGITIPGTAKTYTKPTGDIVQFMFEIPDWHVTQTKINAALGHTGDMKVTVRWDNTGADLYTPRGEYLLTCPPVRKSTKAITESTEQTIENFGHNLKRKKQYIEAAQKRIETVSAKFKAINIQEILQNARDAKNDQNSLTHPANNPDITVQNNDTPHDRYNQLGEYFESHNRADIEQYIEEKSRETGEEEQKELHDPKTYEMICAERKKQGGIKEAVNQQEQQVNGEYTGEIQNSEIETENPEDYTPPGYNDFLNKW